MSIILLSSIIDNMAIHLLQFVAGILQPPPTHYIQLVSGTLIIFHRFRSFGPCYDRLSCATIVIFGSLRPCG